MVGKFDYVVFNRAGNELKITETSYGNPSCTNYPERAKISVSIDNVNWTDLGELCQDGQVDFGIVPYAQYIKITDMSSTASNRFNGVADGYDVDAVVVLNNSCGTTGARLAQFDNTETPDDGIVVSLYPNPVEEYATLSIEGLSTETPFVVDIIDASGRIVRTENIRIGVENPYAILHVNELSRGIYQVSIKNNDYSTVYRMIK